jgi:hypothetical protein
LGCCAQDFVLGYVFGPFVEPEQMSYIGVTRFVRSLTTGRAVQTQDPNRAGVDDALACSPTSCLENIEYTADVDIVEVLWPLGPETVEGSQVKDESGICTGSYDGIGITHVERDSLDVESVKVPAVALVLNKRDYLGATSKESADYSRTDESGCSRNNHSVALGESDLSVRRV